MNVKLSAFLLGLALLAGCATNNANQPGAQGGSTTNPNQIVLLFSKPEKPSIAVGTVSTLKVQPDRSETWESALRTQAAAVGADAIVVDTGTLNNMNTPMVTGTCIRYAKPQP